MCVFEIYLSQVKINLLRITENKSGVERGIKNIYILYLKINYNIAIIVVMVNQSFDMHISRFWTVDQNGKCIHTKEVSKHVIFDIMW